MARKGCGLLLFVSVVTFCAWAAYFIVWFISFCLAWIYAVKTNAFLSPELMLVYLPQFAALCGAIVGIFWGRAMLRDDK